MLVICLLNNIVLRGRGFCTSSIAQITGNVPRLLADIVGLKSVDVLDQRSKSMASRSHCLLCVAYIVVTITGERHCIICAFMRCINLGTCKCNNTQEILWSATFPFETHTHVSSLLQNLLTERHATSYS